MYSIEDLLEFGTKKKWCPYFLARHSVNFADILVFSYQYILDPKISELVSKEFKNNCIVVFDEAHNIGMYLYIYLYPSLGDLISLYEYVSYLTKHTYFHIYIHIYSSYK